MKTNVSILFSFLFFSVKWKGAYDSYLVTSSGDIPTYIQSRDGHAKGEQNPRIYLDTTF